MLYARGKLSEKTQNIINNSPSIAIKDALRPEREFWGSSKTLAELGGSTYFKPDGDTEAGGLQWPGALKKMLDEGTCILISPLYSARVAKLGTNLAFSLLLMHVIKYCLL